LLDHHIRKWRARRSSPRAGTDYDFVQSFPTITLDNIESPVPNPVCSSHKSNAFEFLFICGDAIWFHVDHTQDFPSPLSSFISAIAYKFSSADRFVFSSK
jgi:hypothetical protein